MTDKNVLKDEKGTLHLPVEGDKLLDRIVLYATDEVQKGADPREIIEIIHDATCFWLMNKDMADDQVAAHKKRLN